ncbi:YbbR domain-containing protein [Gracilibacillus halotolerans]|uniref:YbbR domain-containing protein n=1 Tax=Gracilibacillus halotolerans TaxID=74386 RepID=A0A841RRG1_9BACI|nr:CdaR family protein [Gracilibacillus halotolerans]MBB6514407.1 YbbR domain-containing protein [Gracilibacillus halotolerans]
MDKWLEKPWAIRLVSLFLAVLLFAVAAFDQNINDGSTDSRTPSTATNETQTLEDVPIQVEIDEENYVVSGIPDTVTVTLQGPVSLVTPVAVRRNFEVFVNLENLDVGTHLVPIEYNGIPSKVNVYIEPEEIEVIIEERATKEFTANVDLINRDKIEAGYEIANVYTEPSTVELVGSKSAIDRAAIVKAFIDVTGMNESQTIDNVPVKVYDTEGNELNVRVNPPTLKVTLDVKSPNKSVPISLKTENELPDGIQLLSMDLETEEVQVFAPEDFLGTLEEMATKPIDLSSITESGSIEIELESSEQIRRISQSTVTVSIEVETEEDRVLQEIPITVENEPEDLVAEWNPNTINVTLTGFPSVLEGITENDIDVRANLNGLSSGTHEVPLSIELTEEFRDQVEITSETENITVVLTDE